ncbi:hypothetical protein SASPL_127063 [Salvia splendens]|uniref:DUF4005 domain-containing protein n=1 Tax=Salvia splendens TaxID=180675 RepID=A0A8X8ZRK0_SALSN|nr:protein IQ-DOMAIN 25-like [Salvia splendens]KAG6414343.1 hypothetical protein SASPL_127063 [Salvia splendens]
MGKAARWLKALFGFKIKERTDKSRWSSGHLCHNPTTIPPNITPAEAAWLRSFYTDNDKEQNKHAIAVAAATAAAADAAVAAAQAAAAVVRLTTRGGATAEKCAAVKIQSLFRGFLARKALRALKGLVKIQALVRGFLVRKQAAATLQSMQALIRAQASVRAQKMRRLINNDETFPPPYHAPDERSEHPSSFHSRKLSASFETAANSFDESPKIVEVDTGCRAKSRTRRASSWMAAEASPFQCRIPEWGEQLSTTAQSTPRFSGSVTPAKSERGENPSYMAKTQSFKAKVRSQSAPKQRPEPGPKRRMSLLEMMESRNSLSGVRMQRSCSQAQEAITFKNAVMSNFGKSSDFYSN